MVYIIKVTYFCEDTETGKLRNIKKAYVLNVVDGTRGENTVAELMHASHEKVCELFDTDSDEAFADYEIKDASIDTVQFQDNADIYISDEMPSGFPEAIYKLVFDVVDIVTDKKGQEKEKNRKHKVFVTAPDIRRIMQMYVPDIKEKVFAGNTAELLGINKTGYIKIVNI